MANDAKDALAVIPWYWRDWRASTARAVLARNPAAGWCYRELLDAMWGSPTCDLPNDDAELAALAGVSDAKWAAVKDAVLRFLPLDEATGRRTHPRSKHEHDKALAYREGCRAGGRATAAKRWGTDSPPTTEQVAEQPRANRTPSPSPSPTLKSPLPPYRGATELVEAWNAVAKPANLPTVAKLTAARLRTVRVALDDEADVGLWARAFACIAADSWCTGHNDRGWRADFDYAISPSKRGKWLDMARTGWTRPSVVTGHGAPANLDLGGWVAPILTGPRASEGGSG